MAQTNPTDSSYQSFPSRKPIIRLRAILILVGLVLGVTTAFGGELQQTALFARGQDVYHTYRIPAIITTKRGTTLAFCEGRKDAGGDSGNIDIVLKRSTDSGETFEPLQIVWDDEGNTCGNPCPVVDESTGRIHLLLTWNRGDDPGSKLHGGNGKGTRRVFRTYSDDEGRSWAKPVEITKTTKDASWWWYATGPGVGIQIKAGEHAGRLVVPCDHTGPGYFYGSHTIYSDDHGETWQRSEAIEPGCNESQVVELSDGRLMMNMRSQVSSTMGPKERTGYRQISYSSDGGQTWTAPVSDATLIDPVCQATIIRLNPGTPGAPGAPGAPGSKNLKNTSNPLVFANPNSPLDLKRGKRINMTVRLSDDDGVTWPHSKVIFAGPSAYSCLTTLPDGRVGLFYECGEKSTYETITLARFGVDWVKRAPE